MPQPVTVFLRQARMLKDACAACLDKADPKPVHQLRSASRRLEAAMELLAAKGGAGYPRASSKALGRSLRKIRRAAGTVRDLDVHRALLEGYGKSSAAVRLDDQLRRSRKKAAEKLRKLLEKEVRKIQRTLGELEVELKPASGLELPGSEITLFARDWFSTAVRGLDVEKENQLHAIRKASKTARYLAEQGAEASENGAGVAAQFEEVQQTLGAWHDHLLLLKEARANLRAGNPLVREIELESVRLRRLAQGTAKRLIESSRSRRRSADSGISKRQSERPAMAH